jgi:hypothetical protein
VRGVDEGLPGGFNRLGSVVAFPPPRILELRRQGMGATEIAKVVGCKRGAVYLALKAAA